MTQYFVKRNDKVNGPFTLNQIKNGFESEKLKVTDLLATSKDGPWKPLSDFYQQKTVQTQATAKPKETGSHPLGIVTGPKAKVSAEVAPVTSARHDRADASAGLSRKMLFTCWSFVGVFFCCAILFLVWHSHSSHQEKVDAANDEITQAIAKANDWMAENSSLKGEVVEQKLANALNDEDATKKGNGESVLSQVRQRRGYFAEQAQLEKAKRQAAAILNNAKRQIEARRIVDAKSLLQKYVANPHAMQKTHAQQLLNEATVATSDAMVLDALMKLSTEEFERVRSSGQMSDGQITHPVLLDLRKETIQRNLGKATQRREEITIAEEKRREVERLAAMERERQEAEQRKAQEAARLAEEKRRKAEIKTTLAAQMNPPIFHGPTIDLRSINLDDQTKLLGKTAAEMEASDLSVTAELLEDEFLAALENWSTNPRDALAHLRTALAIADGFGLLRDGKLDISGYNRFIRPISITEMAFDSSSALSSADGFNLLKWMQSKDKLITGRIVTKIREIIADRKKNGSELSTNPEEVLREVLTNLLNNTAAAVAKDLESLHQLSNLAEILLEEAAGVDNESTNPRESLAHQETVMAILEAYTSYANDPDYKKFNRTVSRPLRLVDKRFHNGAITLEEGLDLMKMMQSGDNLITGRIVTKIHEVIAVRKKNGSELSTNPEEVLIESMTVLYNHIIEESAKRMELKGEFETAKNIREQGAAAVAREVRPGGALGLVFN